MGSTNHIMDSKPSDSVYRPNSVYDLIWKHASDFPDHIAVSEGDSSLSYLDLISASQRVASILRKRGVGPKDIVPILTSRCLEMVACLLGIVSVGACYVPIDVENWSQERTDTVLANVSAKAIIVTGLSYYCCPNAISGQEIHWAVHTPCGAASQLDLSPSCARSEDSVYIIFTSGTTGMPKGVSIANRSLLHYVQQGGGDAPFNLGVTPSDKVLLLFSIAFDACSGVIFSTLCNGGHLILSESSRFLKDAQKCTILPATPSLLGSLQEPGLYRNIRTIFLGGESPSPALVRKWWLPTRRMYNAYGPTETTISASMAELLPDMPVTLGKPIKSSHMLLLDSNSMESSEGEICISGPGLAIGYFKDANMTKEKFVEWRGLRIYKTSDFGRKTPHGIIFLGRKDSLVKNRGFLINLEVEVVPALLEIPEIQAAVAFMHREKLVAFVSPLGVNIHRLRLMLSDRHDQFHVPDYIRAIHSIPLTPNGKVDVHSLRVELNSSVPDIAESTQHCTTNMDILKAAISLGLCLPVEEIHEDASFWDLGGNSLSAIKVISYLHVKKVSIPLAQLFLLPNLIAISGELVEISQPPGPEFNHKGAAAAQPENKTFDRFESNIPITAVQLGIIRSSLRHPTTGYMLVSVSFDINHQSFDAEQFKCAWEAVLDRHSIFQTAFDLAKGLQKVEAHYKHNWTQSCVTIEQLERAVREESSALLSLPGSHSQGNFFYPVNAFRLITVPGYKANLLWLVHHSRVDGWSMSVIIQEVHLVLSKKPLPNAPQFWKFAQDCKLHITKTYENAKVFWNNIMKDYLDGTQLNLPKPLSRRSSLDEEYTNLGLSLPQIVRSARNLGVSPAVVIYSAWALLLSAYTSQDRVTFGSVFSGRNFAVPLVEQIVGPLINTCPFPVDLQNMGSKIALLRQVQGTLLKISDNQWSAAEALGEIAPGSHSRIFNTILFLEYDLPSFSAVGEEEFGLWKFNRRDIPEFGLTILVEKNDTGLVLRALFDTCSYETPMVSRMLKHFRNLILAITEGGYSSVQDIRKKMLDPAEFMSLVGNSHCFFDEYVGRTNLKDSLEQAVDQWPNLVAVESLAESLTYHQLDQIGNHVAQHITRFTKPGDAVTIISDGSLHWLIGVLSIIKAGAVYVPLDVKLPSQRMEIIARAACAVLCIVPNKICENIAPAAKIPILTLDEIIDPSLTARVERLPTVTKSDDIAYVIFTSGSTGVPKGVRVKHNAVVSYLSYEPARMHAAPGRKHAQMFSAGFDVNIAEIFGTICYGATLVLRDPTDPYAHLQRVHATMITPSFLSVCSPNDLRNLDTILFAGEAVPQSLSDRWSGNRRVYNSYGPCECTIGALFKLLRPGETVTLGNTIPRVGAYLLNSQNNPVPIGVIGEICLYGLQVMDGYVGIEMESQTKARFVADPFRPGQRMYRTGDLAIWTESMEIQFLARMDNQVKVRGYRLELDEIEHAILSSCPTVTHAAALVSDDNVFAFVAPMDVDTCSVQQALRSRLPSYACPSFLVALPALPTTPNQKLDRNALKSRTKDAVRKIPQGQTRRTKTQEILQKIWQETIGLDKSFQIELEDDFMVLGGNSLRQVKAARKISAAFGFAIPLAIIIRNTKLSQLMKALDECVDSQRYCLSQSLSFAAARKTLSERPTALSSLEEELWVWHTVSHNPQTLNVACRLDLQGEIRLEILLQAIRSVVEFEEIFNTCYEYRDGALRRRVCETEFEITVSPASTANIDIASYVNKPFDLSRDHLIRISVFENTPQVSIVLIMHHIITDKVSQRLVLCRIRQSYLNLLQTNVRDSRNSAEDIPKYADWAMWKQSQKTPQALKALGSYIAYWREQIADSPPRPFALQNSIPSRDDGASYSSLITTNLSFRGSLEFYVAVLALSLHDITGMSDIVVGVPYIDRTEPGSEEVIGVFLDRLPIRIQLNHQTMKKPGTLISDIRTRIQGALSHALPYQDVRKHLGNAALFDIMVVYNRKEDSTANAFELPNITVVEHHLRASGAKFPLLVEFTETDDGILYEIEYNTSLLSPSLINELKSKIPFSINALHHNKSLKFISSSYLKPKTMKHPITKSPPTNASQAKIDVVRRAFAEVLGLELGNISRSRRFFDIGGSSLLCLRVHSLLREQGVRASIRDILLGQSAEAIAATV
ncbi:putative non-ribosomal peptide synthetase SirP [Glonium stellatum]|uniref:Putative non-ribosomal peptide synthetase SirP n=1 Tax=Glonium stellatum TaxID=574774 RepID=A0A8E2EPW3_9PEZI|nr:putative non-ribosomal peptide synthetase SirP [Glonium stellatum]